MLVSLEIIQNGLHPAVLAREAQGEKRKATMNRSRRRQSALVGRDSVEPTFERSEASVASILQRVGVRPASFCELRRGRPGPCSRSTRLARKDQGSTESRPTAGYGGARTARP